MSDSRQSAMVKLFLASYDDFKARLKRRLGLRTWRATCCTKPT